MFSFSKLFFLAGGGGGEGGSDTVPLTPSQYTDQLPTNKLKQGVGKWAISQSTDRSAHRSGSQPGQRRDGVSPTAPTTDNGYLTRQGRRVPMVINAVCERTHGPIYRWGSMDEPSTGVSPGVHAKAGNPRPGSERT